MKAAYYREGSANDTFEIITFIVDHKNSADNKLLLKLFGGKTVAYMGFPDSEFRLHEDNNFSGIETYLQSESCSAYKKVNYSGVTTCM